MRELHRWRAYVAVVLLLVVRGAPAQAQATLDQFHAQPLATDGFTLGRTELLQPRAWTASATLDYANDPLIYRLDRGPGLHQRVVADQLALQLGAALGVHRRVLLFMNMPVVLLMRGDTQLALPSIAPEGAGLGDLALGARIALLPADRGRFSVAGELIARLPTAELTRPSQRYTGDRAGSYEAAALGELRLGMVALRVRVGVRLRASEQLHDLTLGQSLLFGTGMRVQLPRDVSLHAELLGSTYFPQPFRQHRTPFELLLGPKVRFRHGWLGAAAGPGLVDGYGSPDFRVIGSLGFGSAPKASPPRAAQPVARDRDFDGVEDAVDACPDQSEDRDGVQDADGCPDLDEDGGAILDDQDVCPPEPKDRDGVDDQDRCPKAIEPARSEQEPEQPPAPEEEPDHVEFGRVHFMRGYERGTPSSEPTLRAVVSILKRHPELTHVRIEGHADDTGNPHLNDRIAAGRARWVASWLIEHGIEPERLEPFSCGQRYPLRDSAADQARRRNRRVEFFDRVTASQTTRDCRPVSPE